MQNLLRKETDSVPPAGVSAAIQVKAHPKDIIAPDRSDSYDTLAWCNETVQRFSTLFQGVVLLTLYRSAIGGIGDWNRGLASGTDGTFSDSLSVMARLAHIALVSVSYHVTQRGNARQFILSFDEERAVYLSLLPKYARLHELQLLGYRLMSSHVHRRIVEPRPPWYLKSDRVLHSARELHAKQRKRPVCPRIPSEATFLR